ncbi:AfsR/SARP family transcriptional regulator [Actinobacteria bacterium YIM 96077]|uniref:AfsR/SARP family transcriptional regulator n=1 Tax=Phytoactinopolyspora halophila TaxID=1981511 RepID=A0A329QMG7_9ACTN|nr:BTAD domain-containing putative transcriptional regulator [Phytoactinopolyspora halophila]AYY14847.1 AfsR/SARP family transcriptional regulator [Actinobacteria bacterium YIM 96077]RAW13121.1 AfsR/SARP family transcriptional regulator [Phytoactinopolyspora halophila]
MTIQLTLLSRVAYRGQEISGTRLRSLLAMLAGDLHTGCSTARLVEGLWRDEQPENPAKALQIVVSRARTQLGSDLIITTPTGYRLSLRDDEVDASAILHSASASARCSRAGDYASALAHAEDGLALWEEAESDDTASDDPVSALRAERASTYRSLVRARALALSRLGRYAEAVEPLADLIRERPRDEELLRELLFSEAATVGAPAALVRYETYRRTLRDELGVDPGADLQDVHRQLLHEAEPAVRHGVVEEPNALLGRDGDVAAVADLMRTSRVTSIVGAGGLGKTRLAHAVSRQVEQRSVHVVALAGVTSDDDVASEVASVLGVGESRRASVGHRAVPSDLLGGIANALGHGPAVLVLDNCEHVISGVAELVRSLLSMTQHVRVLTTSRAPLGLSSESVYMLPELDRSTTVELFEQRARAARSDVDLPAGTVAELCRHLDGLPLAVELAAARVRVMSVAEIVEGLKDRFGLLRGGPRDAPERHHTLRAVIEWSWNLLDSAGQASMRALSIFPGGFTAAAAAYLLDEEDVRHVLEQLVDQSLLKVSGAPSGTRFSMLETVREFSASLREEAGETEDVIDGFLAWARDFGMAYHESPFGAEPFVATERIRTEQDNLMQALRYGIARVDGATVAATSAVLGSLWIVETNHSRLTTLVGDSAWVLSHFRPEPEFVDVVRAASTLSVASAFMLEGPSPVRSLVTLRRLPQAPPNTFVRAVATVLRAAPEFRGPDRSALHALCDSDEPLVAGIARGIASYLAEQEGDLEGALVAADGMAESLADSDVPWMRLMAQTRVAELNVNLERGVEARWYLESALRVLEELGGSDHIGIRGALALVNLSLGDIDEAERWLNLVTCDPVNDSVADLAFGVGVRAEIALARGDRDTGLRLWRQAFDQLRNAESPFTGGDPAMDPWLLEIQAAAVVAHAHHGRLDLVENIAGELPPKVSTMLANPVNNPPAYLMELAVCGAILLALAMVDIDHGQRSGDEHATRSGVRLVALAERFRFVRNFQPTMSSARARDVAEQADRPAYEDAVSSYAGLTGDELRAVALKVLRSRRPS